MTSVDPPPSSDSSHRRHGPFTRWLFALHLAPSSRRRLNRSTLAPSAALWFTFLLCALIDRAFTGKTPPLFQDLSAHVRVLVSIPSLLLSESIHHERSAYVLDRLSDGKIVQRSHHEEVARILATAERRRHSRIVEYALWALGFSFGLLALKGRLGTAESLQGVETAAFPGVAHVWYVLLVVPVYVFLFARAIWRWIVWSASLFQVSRVELRFAPTHPDRAGGLGFLSEPVAAAAVVSFAISAGMSARWRTEAKILHFSVRNFAPSFGVLFAAAVILSIGPLLFFSVPAFRARLRAEREHSRLVLHYVQEVHAAWFERQPQPESAIGVFDSSSMADIDSTYQNLLRMRLVPVEPKMLLAVALGVSLPFVISMASEIPMTELLRTVGHALAKTLF
ncbi:MAG TPA: hypothetical protein VHC69_32215 [Polyangiaceae bacterium]|nr:hypothetical protein [Polyangiaceae bacterium]